MQYSSLKSPHNHNLKTGHLILNWIFSRLFKWTIFSPQSTVLAYEKDAFFALL